MFRYCENCGGDVCLFTSPWLHKEYFHSGEVEVSPYLPKSLSYKADIFIFVSNVGQTKQLSLCQKLLASACNTVFFKHMKYREHSSEFQKLIWLTQVTAQKMIIKALERQIHACTKAVSAHTAEILLGNWFQVYSRMRRGGLVMPRHSKLSKLDGN